MTWYRKMALSAGALVMATGGLAATASPAAAVGGCPAGKLCLYAGTNYTNMKLSTGSIDSCWDLPNYGLTSVKSYVNNMSVKATIWDRASNGEYYLDGTISPKRFSSNAGANFGYYGIACTE
ncbi:peptidase inhibitor family I36 protein [Streptomyces sp. NPDC048383]|uniref:peptidase inhibitor family I36 protein n=1 Tax=Streptomyces sp. NPDC048383 TaxID=3155386 RepID=UPI003427F316